MPRLRQYYPQNYATSQNISAEFENFIRYINSAEYGNKTLSELLSQIFDASGDPDIPVEIRYDSVSGLQVRVGVFTDLEDGWTTIASPSDIRGAPGMDVGTIDAPVLFNKSTFTGNGSTTNFAYALTTNVDVLVYVNGVLQSSTGYTKDVDNKQIIFGAAPANGASITFWSFRVDTTTAFQRVEFTAALNQVVFPFPHNDGDTIIVFRNGLLQREGGSYDYVASATNDTITFMVALNTNDIITVVQVDSSALKRVAGLMMEADFVDTMTGLIPYTKLSIADSQITQAKVAGLTTALAGRAVLTVSATTPPSAVTGNFWLNTAVTPNLLYFYDGSSWLSTSPEQMLPSFNASNARQYVRLNATGTGFEYGTIDLSAYVLKATIGEPNGVAQLDSTGAVPIAQIPDFYTVIPLSYIQDGSVTNATKKLQKFHHTKVRIDALDAKTSSGTLTLGLTVNGVSTGATYNVTSSTTNFAISPAIEIDASSTGKVLALVISAATTANDLEVGFAATALAV